MTEDESITIPEATFAFPKYYPLHTTLGKNLSLLSYNSSSKQIKNLELDLQRTFEKYVDISLELNRTDLEEIKSRLPDDELYKDSVRLMEQIKDIKIHSNRITSLLTETKLEMSYRFRNEEELNIETLGQYQSLEDTPKEVHDLLYEKTVTCLLPSSMVDEFEAAIKKFEDQAVVYINPYAVVKSQEEDGDDDLEVEGGKVELKCPLSQLVMTDPVITQCKHSFDRKSLEQYKRESRSSECPVCGKNMGTVTKDELMACRLKGLERDQRLV